jgi:hypothetical protein
MRYTICEFGSHRTYSVKSGHLELRPHDIISIGASM